MASEQIREFWTEQFGRPEPEKIICIGLNYLDHAAEGGVAAPALPLLFAKYANSLVGNGEVVVLPRESTHVDAEAELALVIGEDCRRVPRERALDVIAGYTCANDISARDLQFADGQWLRGKSYDTFCPVLPTLVPVSELGDGSGTRVIQRVNGEVLQDAPTSDLIFDIPTLVAHASTAFSLVRGDLILTGTPPGVGYFREPKHRLRDGDVVDVDVNGVGTLSNPIRAER